MAESVQNAASEPVTFEEYRLGTTSVTSEEAQPLKEDKVEPELETGQDTQEPKGKSLTDEEKAERKRINDSRREKRWFEERGEMRERQRQLERELAELKASQSKRYEPTFQMEGKPTLKAFLESGMFKTYEDAHEAFTEALTEWKLESTHAKLEASRVAESQQAEVERVGKAYQVDVREFEKEHEDYPAVKAEVAERLDSPNDKGELVGNPLTAAILKSKNPAKLIYHLGNDADLLDEFSEYAASGDFETALERLGEVKASLGIGRGSVKPTTAPEKKETVSTTRNPKHVGGRSAVVNRDDALRNAADKNDFSAFQAANRAKVKA